MQIYGTNILTSQAPLTKFPWPKTYIGSVSHKQLVLLILIPLVDISLQALSIMSIRSPRLLPRAIYAVCFPGDPLERLESSDGLSLLRVEGPRGCWGQWLIIVFWVAWRFCRIDAIERDILDATLQHPWREETFRRDEAPALATFDRLKRLIGECRASLI
jgi:hypothetical protein